MAEKKNAFYPWIVLIIICLGGFIPNYTQYQLSPLAPQLIQSFKLSTSEFASIFSSVAIPAIFFSLVAGLLVDKFGIKRIIGVGFIIAAIGTVWRIWSDSYITLFASMLLTGFGITFLNANAAKVGGSWFPPEKVGSRTGIFLSASTLGMTVGTGTTALLSIQSAYRISAALSVIFVVLWFLFIKNPEDVNPDDRLEEKNKVNVLHSLKVVLKSRTVWLTGICLMFILGCNVVISSFLPTALGQRGLDSVTAGMYAAFVTGGSLIGCLFAPVLSERVGKNRPVMMFFALVSAAGTAFSWLAPVGVLLGLCLCITGIALGGLMPLLMSIPIQLKEIGPGYAGTAGGVTATLQLLGAVLIPTYIIAPIAGQNMNLFFILGAVCMLCVFLFVFTLPELGKGKGKREMV